MFINRRTAIIEQESWSVPLSNLFTSHSIANFDPHSILFTNKVSLRTGIAYGINNVVDNERFLQLGFGVTVDLKVLGNQTLVALVSDMFQSALSPSTDHVRRTRVLLGKIMRRDGFWIHGCHDWLIDWLITVKVVRVGSMVHPLAESKWRAKQTSRSSCCWDENHHDSAGTWQSCTDQ